MGRRARSAHGAALRSLLALLVALTALACARTSAAAGTGPPTATAAAAGQGTPAAHSVQAPAGGDSAETEKSLSRTGCSGTHDVDGEALTTRAPSDTAAAAPAPLDQRPGTARTDHDGPAPGRGGPAPPPTAPSLEALSVLRV